jgi:hypothetical protein
MIFALVLLILLALALAAPLYGVDSRSLTDRAHRSRGDLFTSADEYSTEVER